MARGALEGPPVPADRGIPWLAQVTRDRILDRYDAVHLWTGKERISKSTGALRFVQAATAIGCPFDWADLCYSARQLLDSYERAKRDRVPGRIIWFDESARGLLAEETVTPEQRVLKKLLIQAGVVNAILVLVIPDIWQMAKKIRVQRAGFWIHVDSRGGPLSGPAPSHAIVKERDDRLHNKPQQTLGFADSRRCPELTYLPFDDTDPWWVRYSTAKDAALDDWFTEGRAILDRAEAQVRAPPRGIRKT